MPSGYAPRRPHQTPRQKHVPGDDHQRLGRDWLPSVREGVALDEPDDCRACCGHRESRPEDLLEVVIDRIWVGEVLDDAIE